MNNIILIGKLGKDIELKFTQGGVAIATGTLAVKRGYHKEGQQDTDWMQLKCFGKNAENMANFFSKGSEIAIKGAYQIDQYEKDGEKKSFHYIKVDSWEFTGGSKKIAKNEEPKKDDFYQNFDVEDSSIPF